ncbi:MAG TPA: hypothetical protein VL793_03805 [Patescibacteria group bacterium]|jgi:hypothetical protein|nr:hypothetical protein [Patescibacteria group bacterium]
MNALRGTLFSLLFAALCLAVSTEAIAAGASGSKPLDQTVTDLKTASAGSDATLKSLADETAGKAAALDKSLGTNSQAKAQLQQALASLTGNRGAASLSSLQGLSKAKLTPEQGRLAKDVYHTGSAYVVQRNFSSLEGSQGEVAQLVGSLRKGGSADALPALKKIGENAKLTADQKDLLSSLSDQYAPGLKKAGNALKKIPGFGQ